MSSPSKTLVKWFDAGGTRHVKECFSPAEVSAWIEMLSEAGIAAWAEPAPPEPAPEPCGYCSGTGGVYHGMYDNHGYKKYDEPPCYPCEYCGGTGRCVDGHKLLPARPREFYMRDEQ